MKKRRLRLTQIVPRAGRVGRLLFRRQVLIVFLGLCIVGLWVGLQTRPRSDTVPYKELFDAMSVVSYREAPTDTSARFVIELSSCGRTFSQYDVDAGTFQPPPRGRDYSRNITATTYRPLRVRGHVANGFWIDMPNASLRSLLPEQFDELYRTTLGFVKPLSLLTGALGIASGYSVGYRLGTWNGSLCSRAVQKRVLATPGLGRTLVREAWRRVLLEPAVMVDETDAARFAALAGTQRLYAGFFRIALNDSDGFIPREAERLAQLGRTGESRVMLAFAAAVRRAAIDSVDLKSADFEAIERWASLLDRRGHWALGSIPTAGEERVRLLGMFAWYGVAPPSSEASRVWVGPRLLVREGDTEGFVTDDITATVAGCPIGWRDRLTEEYTGMTAIANAWLADRPEFVAVAALGQSTVHAVANAGRNVVAWQHERAVRAQVQRLPRVTAVAAHREGGPMVVLPEVGAGALVEGTPVERTLRSFGDEGRMVLLSSDSVATAELSRVAQSVLTRADDLIAAAPAPEGGERPVHQPEWDAAIRDMGARDVVFDTTARRLSATVIGIRMDLRDIAAGHALDVAADTLRSLGVHDALLELPGGTVAIGAPPEPDYWRIAVRDPQRRVPNAAWVRLEPGEAACAGEKHAGPDPAAKAEPPFAVVVVAPSALSARAWRTELLGMTLADARRRAGERDEVSAVLIESVPGGPDILWVESAIKDQIHLEDAAKSLFRIQYF